MLSIFSKPVPIPAWATILLTINFHLALMLEIVLTIERVGPFSGLYDIELIYIAVFFVLIPMVLYYALCTQKLVILGLIFMLDSLDLAGRVFDGSPYIFERGLLFLAFWIVPACVLWVNRIQFVRYIRARYIRR